MESLQMRNLDTLFAQIGHFLYRIKHKSNKVDDVDAIQNHSHLVKNTFVALCELYYIYIFDNVLLCFFMINGGKHTFRMR